MTGEKSGKTDKITHVIRIEMVSASNAFYLRAEWTVVRVGGRILRMISIEVLPQRVLQDKRPRAKFTFERSLTAVYHLVSLQDLLLDERTIADVALEWLFAGVHANVPLQRAVAREPETSPCIVNDVRLAVKPTFSRKGQAKPGFNHPKKPGFPGNHPKKPTTFGIGLHKTGFTPGPFPPSGRVQINTESTSITISDSTDTLGRSFWPYGHARG